MLPAETVLVSTLQADDSRNGIDLKSDWVIQKIRLSAPMQLGGKAKGVGSDIEVAERAGVGDQPRHQTLCDLLRTDAFFMAGVATVFKTNASAITAPISLAVCTAWIMVAIPFHRSSKSLRSEKFAR